MQSWPMQVQIVRRMYVGRCGVLKKLKVDGLPADPFNVRQSALFHNLY